VHKNSRQHSAVSFQFESVRKLRASSAIRQNLDGTEDKVLTLCADEKPC